MKKFSILFLMTALSLIAAALEKNYPLIQEKDVEISKYNSAFSTSLSSVQDPESGRDVLKITYAVKPGTRKNVNLNLSFPALQADQWAVPPGKIMIFISMSLLRPIIPPGEEGISGTENSMLL